MMSIEKFVQMCGERIKRGEPFVAYWHARGMAIMRTSSGSSEAYVIDIPDRFGAVSQYITFNREERDRYKARGFDCATQVVQLKVKKGSVSKMLKEIQRMRKSRTWGLCVVEFNGYTITTEGDFGGMDAYQELAVLLP